MGYDYDGGNNDDDDETYMDINEVRRASIIYFFMVEGIAMEYIAKGKKKEKNYKIKNEKCNMI